MRVKRAFCMGATAMTEKRKYLIAGTDFLPKSWVRYERARII